MDKKEIIEEIKEYLKENLKIKIVEYYLDNSMIQLILENEIISEDCLPYEGPRENNDY